LLAGAISSAQEDEPSSPTTGAGQERALAAQHAQERLKRVEAAIAAIVNETFGVLGLDLPISDNEIVNDASFVGAGDGIPSEASVEATWLFARTEGVIPRSDLYRQGSGRHDQRYPRGPLRQR
jgi:hypothetical protein